MSGLPLRVRSMEGLGVILNEGTKGLTMLAWWWELMPLFVVRWAALRYCERFQFRTSPELRVAMARPDVLVKLPQKLRDMTEDDFTAAHGG